MDLRPFVLNMEQVAESDIGQAAFFALLAAGWGLYVSWLFSVTAAGTEVDKLTIEERIQMARRAFEFVGNWMPPTQPFRRELERYAREALPNETERLTLTPKLQPFPF